MKSLRYIGKNRNRRLNGKPLETGQIIEDTALVRDLDGHSEFEAVEPEERLAKRVCEEAPTQTQE